MERNHKRDCSKLRDYSQANLSLNLAEMSPAIGQCSFTNQEFTVRQKYLHCDFQFLTVTY